MIDSIKGGKRFPTLIWASLSAIALSTASPASLAQESDSADEDKVMEEVLVTGIRTMLQKNLDIKRDSAAIVDAITAEDIGKFPDKNLADALQRVPGVSITRDGGEGQFVSVRGVSPELTLTLLNGNYVATAVNARDPVRSFNYALLPSSQISRVEVYKTPEARLDEGGIGGTVIISTRKPLEMDSNSGYLNAEGTWADVTKKWEGQYSGLYSWKNEDETFGILASYSQQDRTATSEYIRTESWFYFGYDSWKDAFGIPTTPGGCPVKETCWVKHATVDGTPIEGYGPGAIVMGVKEEEREQAGYQVTMQWAPNDRFDATFNYLGADMSQDNETIEVNGYLVDFYTSHPSWQDFGGAFPASRITDFRVDNGTITMMKMEDQDGTGGVDLSAYAAGGFIFEMDSKSDTYDLELNYSGDFWRAHINAGFTEADGGVNRGIYQRLKGIRGATSSWGYDLNASQILFGQVSEYNATDWNQPDFGGTHSDEETYVQLDVSFDTEAWIFKSFDVGAKWRDHEVIRTNSNTYYDDDDPCNENRWGYPPCILGFHWWHTVQNEPPASVIPSFLKPGSSLTGTLGTGTAPLLGMDFNAYEGWIKSNFQPIERTNQQRVFTVGEEILALYAQANFSFGPVSGNIGLRYVDTDQDAKTFNCYNFTCEDEPLFDTGGQSEVLPSLNIKWELTEDLLVRASAAEVMSRVGYAELGTALVWYAGNGGLPGNGTAGNADLEPYKANQFDLGLEWYFQQGAILGATLFYKDIKTFITKNTELVTLQIADQDYLVNVTTPVNGNDATSEGIEVFYQQGFEWGGGLIANYTYTDTSLATAEIGGETTKTPLPGASENQFNVSAYYENDKWSARISYNWRDKYAIQPYQGNIWYTDDYQQVDANLAYHVNEQLTVNASVINLTEESVLQYWGQPDRPIDERYPGRRIYVGVNYKF